MKVRQFIGEGDKYFSIRETFFGKRDKHFMVGNLLVREINNCQGR